MHVTKIFKELEMNDKLCVAKLASIVSVTHNSKFSCSNLECTSKKQINKKKQQLAEVQYCP